MFKYKFGVTFFYASKVFGAELQRISRNQPQNKDETKKNYIFGIWSKTQNFTVWKFAVIWRQKLHIHEKRNNCRYLNIQKYAKKRMGRGSFSEFLFLIVYIDISKKKENEFCMRGSNRGSNFFLLQDCISGRFSWIPLCISRFKLVLTDLF